MRIPVGSDHAGVALRATLTERLRRLGHEVSDLGTETAAPVDYPDYGAAVGESVAGGATELGVCICGTGIGIAIAANKVAGVRAAVVHDVSSARLARAHNDANVICFGARLIGEIVALDALEAFLETSFCGGRHLARIAKIAALEERSDEIPGKVTGARRAT